MVMSPAKIPAYKQLREIQQLLASAPNCCEFASGAASLFRNSACRGDRRSGRFTIRAHG